jgi:hypothetical protein
MGAWVATVLRDLFHHTGSKASSPPAPRPAGVIQTGITMAGGSHVR